MNPDEIRKAVRPFIPGWVPYPKFSTFNGYSMRWYNAAGTELPLAFSTDFDVVRQAAAGNANDGDYAIIKCILAAGNYTIRHYYTKSSTAGKHDIYVDGVKVTSSVIDQYAASTAQAATDTAITLAVAGEHTFKWLVNGKHASSGDYYLYMGLVSIVITAY